jgi:hypothetical protein
MNLKEELLRGIYAYGFEKPSAIQQRAIVPCIKVGTVIFTYLKGLSHEKDFKNFDKKLQNLAYLWDAAGF